MNNERLLKIIEDMQECKADIDECIYILENSQDNKLMIKLAKSSLRQLFVGFHTILEDFCSLILKELKKFKIGITLNDSLTLLRDNNVFDEETYIFLEKSRLIRNRIAHRYKEPKHEELLAHIVKDKDKIDTIIKIAKSYLKL
jgi:uncharacterized protein YutE (UPF0331/DUF86 family)